MEITVDMTTYTVAELKRTARWALGPCAYGKHPMTVTAVHLRIHPRAGSAVSLHVEGICKRHNYKATTDCAI